MPLILSIYIFIAVTFFIIEGILTLDSINALWSPKTLKDCTTMNWFGVIVCWTLWSICSPIMLIGKGIYWLFHI